MLGPVRLTLGLLLCWNWMNLGLDFSSWFGPEGWLPLSEAISLRNSTLPWGWSLWDVIPQAAVLPFYVVSFIVTVLWTFGFRCRVTGPLVWLIFYSTIRRLPVMLFGFDSVIGTLVLYLAVTGSGGESVSMDRWLARRDSQSRSPSSRLRGTLGIRLIQIHLCVIYAAAGLSKLLGETWWNGTAAYFLVANTEFRGVSLLETLGESPNLTAICTLVPLWTEILYPILVWFASWRPLMIWLAVGMHFFIGLTLGLWEFSLTMIAANMAFMSPDWFTVKDVQERL
jgi:hypothetical protein